MNGTIPRWQDRALCRPEGPLTPLQRTWFTSGAPIHAKRAIALCQGCEVRAECLEWAVVHDEPVGIWGGVAAGRRHLVWRAA